MKKIRFVSNMINNIVNFQLKKPGYDCKYWVMAMSVVEFRINKFSCEPMIISLATRVEILLVAGLFVTRLLLMRHPILIGI